MSFQSEFRWESKEQKEGYNALLKWVRDFKDNIPRDEALASLTPEAMACFFIQKDHDANEYWRELIGNQFARLEEEIVRLRSEREMILDKLAYVLKKIEDA